MASAENKKHLDETMIPAKARSLLLSFFYLIDKPFIEVEEYLMKCKSVSDRLFLDSGAHTIIVAYGGKDGVFSNNYKNKINLEDYVKKFFLFIERFHHYFYQIAELDIGMVVGHNTILKWRENMKRMGMKDKMVVVSHYKYFTEQLGDWKKERRKMCEEYPMLAIGDGPKGQVLRDHFKIRKEVGKMNKIHGFAETKVNKTINYPYFSVDSTTRLTGGSFGNLFLYDKIEHRMVQMHHKEKKKILKYFDCVPKEYRKIQWLVDTDKQQVGYIRNLINIKSFQKMEEDMTEIWKTRGIVFNN